MEILAFGILFIFLCPRNQLLTKNELNGLISEKGIHPVCINDISNSYTAIIYEDSKQNETVELIAYKNIWGRINTRSYAFYQPSREGKVDVEYWTIEPYRINLLGYVGVEIIDTDIYEKARSVEVTLDNGLVERASFQNSNILLIPAERRFFWEKPKLKTIEIYDENGNVIHGFYS
jgi:hypothetical protein